MSESPFGGYYEAARRGIAGFGNCEKASKRQDAEKRESGLFPIPARRAQRDVEVHGCGQAADDAASCCAGRQFLTRGDACGLPW